MFLPPFKSASPCQACCNLHGESYGGNLLICAMHPYGPDGADCPDREAKIVQSNWWLLKGRTPVPCSARKWADEGSYRKIAQSQIGPVLVSTVFLGRNHNFGESGPPILFETMCFGDLDFGSFGQVRYATYDEAEAGHAAAVAFVKELLEPLVGLAEDGPTDSRSYQ